MVKQSLPAVSSVNEENLDEVKTMDKIVIIGYIGADDKEDNNQFTSFAESQRDNYVFGVASDPVLAKTEDVKQPSVVLYKDFDEKKAVYDGKFDTDSIANWVKTASTPLVGEVNQETYFEYMTVCFFFFFNFFYLFAYDRTDTPQSGIPLGYIFAQTKEEREKFVDEFKPIAEKHRGAINIATIDAQIFGAHAGNLNLDPEKFPSFAIQETSGRNSKYPYDQSKEFNAKDIGQFIQDVLDGKVEPSVKSEPIPEGQEGPVTVVVGLTYQDLVIDNDKDVLVEFYAPWCGHCKALAPKYEELASLYAESPNLSSKVTIAKIDATNNDVPEAIQGFPTIKLFPAGEKDSPVEYEGDRSVDDLVEFVKKNGKYKVDGRVIEDDEDAQEQESTSTSSISSKTASETDSTHSSKADHDEL